MTMSDRFIDSLNLVFELVYVLSNNFNLFLFNEVGCIYRCTDALADIAAEDVTAIATLADKFNLVCKRDNNLPNTMLACHKL